YEYEQGTGRCVRTWAPNGLHDVTLHADRIAKITETESEEPRIYTWNDQGLVIKEQTPDGAVLKETAYDQDCFLIAETNGVGEGRQHWYDAHGNRIRTVDAAGNVTAWEYEDDQPVRITTPDGLVTQLFHDNKGALTAVLFPTGLTYTMTYD